MSASQSYGLQAFFSQIDATGIAVTLLLLAMSLISWYLIFSKSARVWRIRRRGGLVVARFWDAPNLKAAAQLLRDDYSAEPASRLALSAISAAERHGQRGERLGDRSSLSELVVRTLRDGLSVENARLESGLSVLASIGAVAPFVGLFGTVWGIYHALVSIGAGDIATLDKVAGPVGEALIMTAAGLAVAVPAVLAYNALARANRMITAVLDGFAHDLRTYLTAGVEIESAQAPSLKSAAKGAAA